MSVPAPEPDPRGRPLIYAVGPETEVDGTSSIRRWPGLLKNLVATLAMMSVALGGGVTAIWLVLAPTMPVGAVTAQLQQRSSQPSPTRPANRMAEPATGAPDALATTPPVAEHDDWLQPPVLAKRNDEAKAVATRVRKCS